MKFHPSRCTVRGEGKEKGTDGQLYLSYFRWESGVSFRTKKLRDLVSHFMRKGVKHTGLPTNTRLWGENFSTLFLDESYAPGCGRAPPLIDDYFL